ncbi:MAG: hypothetical protein IIA78_05375 [Proteobacteria bacterium]|nr:hypothetical protein [Pseudomonadota bacterium]
MAKLRTIALIALVFGMMAGAHADTLQMDGIVTDAESPRPTRGMTQSNVESSFGSPVSRKAAVGDPPISSWEYQGFVVFFEYDRVIHAVVKR